MSTEERERARRSDAGASVPPAVLRPAIAARPRSLPPTRPAGSAAFLVSWGPLITDAISIFGLTFLFQAIRFGGEGGAVDIGVDVIDYRVFSVIVSVAWVLGLLIASGRARGNDVGVVRYRGIFVATFGTFLGTAVFALMLQSEVSRAFVLTVFPLGIVVLVIGRLLWAGWLRRQRSTGRVVTRTLLVGSEGATRRLEREFVSRRHSGIHVTAIGTHSAPAVGVSELPPLSTIPSVTIGSGTEVARLAVDSGSSLVIVADAPANDPNFLQDLSWALVPSRAQLAVSSQFGLVAASRLTIVPIGGHPLVAVESTYLSRSKHLAKRSFDLVASLAALAIVWPFFAAIALAVRLDSPGPAIFTQERVGRDGHPFRMHKFRSMHVGSEAALAEIAELNENDGLLFKMRVDPRVTRVGRILRQTSLDELPQIVNVLKGDMSFVGPRPAIPSEVAQYEEDARRRLLLRPGLTGVWQVSGRSDLPWEEGLRLDLTYVENWSMLGDIVVLFRTVGAVVARRGAY